MRKFFWILLLCLYSVAVAQDKPYRILNSFSAGELTPLLSAREDLSKYQSGCSLMENLFPLPQGGAQKRPGTKYVAEVKDSNYPTRVISFEYSTEQAYIIELGNEYMRFYKDGGQIQTTVGTEDLSALSANLVAHWKLNDDATSTAVDDDVGVVPHDGIASSNTEDLHKPGKVGTGCFDLNLGVDSVTVGNNAALSFGNGVVDSPFSIAAWVYVTTFGTVIAKWEDTTGPDREWTFQIGGNRKLRFFTYDEANNKRARIISNDAMTLGWHFVVATYAGYSGTGVPSTYMKLYVDSVLQTVTATDDAGYVAMTAGATDVLIGGYFKIGVPVGSYPDKMDNIALFNKELSAAELTALYSTGVYEIESPFTPSEIFGVRYTQSADVLYLVHSDHHPQMLSRYWHDSWEIEDINIINGPFLAQNETDVTITPNSTTGNISLTASASIFDMNHEGALWQVTHTVDANVIVGSLSVLDAVSANLTMQLGRNVRLVTDGSWTGTIALQKSYDNGTNWKDVTTHALKSASGSNLDFSGEEIDGDAIYRVKMIEFTGATDCDYTLTAESIDIDGVVKITSYTNPTVVNGDVQYTLGDTTATKYWAEGAWSDKRGYPKTITFFQDRLMFGGNNHKPQTIWGSKTGDYYNMKAGAEDDDALDFTISSNQINVIRWLIGKKRLLIGTSGAEWTMSGSNDEPLTPSNVKAEQQSTLGSAYLQANLVSDTVLFFQRNAKKMRELTYNWELNSYVAPDMTILAKEVTGDGIIDTSFQQIPDSILWCIRDDGETATFSYERKELITSWARQITDGSFESVAIIHGDPEDEVWVSVERTIDGNDVRYIEYFSARDFNSDINNAFYVDCGATYTTDVNVISDLDWLEGEDVFVLADGNVIDNDGNLFNVDSNTVTLGDVYQTVHIGLPYTVQLRTMPLSWLAQGMTIQGLVKRINGIVPRWFESGDFYYGKDVDHKELVSIDRMTTGETSHLKTFPPGYDDKSGRVFIYQYSPEPLTLLALMIEFQVY